MSAKEDIGTPTDNQVWIPSEEELVGWSNMFATLDTEGTPQFVVVGDHVYRVTDTGHTTDEFLQIWQST